MATANTKRSSNAREDDLYTTPHWAIRAILKRESMVGIIADAGYGTGNITNTLVSHGYSRLFIQTIDKYRHAMGLDVQTDFLTYDPEYKFENVITNPPFKLFIPFVEQAIKLSKHKTLVFARINALETPDRHALYKKYKPTKIYSFVSRVACPKGYAEKGEGAVMYCWIVWDKQADQSKPTEFHWIDDHSKDVK